jgi:hypothetical protein
MPADLSRFQARRFAPVLHSLTPWYCEIPRVGSLSGERDEQSMAVTPIFIVSRADAAKNHASLRLGRAGADAMKAVAIVSGWIACTDETGERRAIPKGTRIRIEKRADGYRVSWRDLSGRRRAARWTDDELDLYRSHALRSYIEAI